MQLSVNIQTQDIVSLISQMTLDEIETVKNSLNEREQYLQNLQNNAAGSTLDSAIGMWHDREIYQDTIRKKAWGLPQ